MHFVWRHSIFTVIVSTIVKSSDAKLISQLTNDKFYNNILFVTRDFQFFNQITSANLEKEKIICIAKKEFTENLLKKPFYCTTMAPRRGAKKAQPTVQAEAAVADSATDAASSNGIENKVGKAAKATKSAPPAKKTASSKKNVAEEQHQQDGNDAVENDVVQPVSDKIDAKLKKTGASKKNAKAIEQNGDAGQANGQATNGDAPDDGAKGKRAAKGKQKKVEEEAAPVKETKAAKGKAKKVEQETVEDHHDELQPGPSKVDKKKGKSAKQNVEPAKEVPVEAKGRRGAKKPVSPEKPVKGKAGKSNAKQNVDEPADQDDVEEKVAPTKGRAGKRAAPATAVVEKSPAKKGKKDAGDVAGTSSAKSKANGTSNKKRKAGVKAAADSTTNETDVTDGQLVTKRKKGTKDDAEAEANSESKMNPTESDLSQIDFETDKEFTLKIVSWNVAGLRAMVNKNGMDYFGHEKPDIICLQVHVESNLCNKRFIYHCNLDFLHLKNRKLNVWKQKYQKQPSCMDIIHIGVQRPVVVVRIKEYLIKSNLSECWHFEYKNNTFHLNTYTQVELRFCPNKCHEKSRRISMTKKWTKKVVSSPQSIPNSFWFAFMSQMPVVDLSTWNDVCVGINCLKNMLLH